MTRADGRRPDQLRPVEADTAFLEQPHGSVLWSQGRTKVLCTASVEDGVPRWLYRSGRGWMTADGRLVEVQATAERVPFDRDRLDELLDLGAGGIEQLAARQREAVDAPLG